MSRTDLRPAGRRPEGRQPEGRQQSAGSGLSRVQIIGLTVLITAAAMLGPLGTDFYLPGIPDMMTSLAIGSSSAQLTISVFVVGVGVGQAIVGPMSDRWGRRRILLGGMALYAVMAAAAAAAQSIDQLLALRVLQALGSATGTALSRAIIRDLFDREDAARLMSFVGGGIALGPMIGPLFGGILVIHWGWRAAFLGLAVISTLVLFGLALGLRETNRHRDPTATQPRQILRNYAVLLGHPVYVAYLTASALTFAALFSYVSGVSFVLIGQMGMRPDAFGAIFGISAAGYVVGSLVSARLVRRRGIARMTLDGALIMLVMAVLMVILAVAGVAHPAAVIGPIFVFFVGCGWVLPSSFAGAISPFPHMAGTASALMGMIQFIFAAGVGVLVGINPSQLSMAAIIAVVTLVMVVLLRTMLPRAETAVAGLQP